MFKERNFHTQVIQQSHTITNYQTMRNLETQRKGHFSLLRKSALIYSMFFHRIQRIQSRGVVGMIGLDADETTASAFQDKSYSRRLHVRSLTTYLGIHVHHDKGCNLSILLVDNTVDNGPIME